MSTCDAEKKHDMTKMFESLSVGRQDGEDKSRIWFARWFLEQGKIVAPGCTWEVRGNSVWRTYHEDYVRPSGLPNVEPTVWVLADRYGCELSRSLGLTEDEVHCSSWDERLAVWPD